MMPMRVCNATYVRIIDVDVFVPKFIFIPNIEDDAYKES
jgi:hypothetical protein